MNCQNCNGSTDIDRVIVEKITKTVLGVLCDACRREHFSKGEHSGEGAGTTGCTKCADPAYYVLPRFDCLIQPDDGSGITIEYTLTPASPRVCGSHMEAIVGTHHEAATVSDQALEVS